MMIEVKAVVGDVVQHFDVLDGGSADEVALVLR
jgi:hypothetical protein